VKETDRSLKLFEDLYNGNPWIDVNMVNVLSQINAIQASKKILPHLNSIWEMANHLISWRMNVLQRVQGKIMNAPENNYFNPIEDTSENAWSDTLNKLKESQRQWIDFLKTFKEEDFDEIYTGNNMTYYDHIHGIIQHDAYHLGQIVLLTKFK
jgi:uncharacterized damage-inducible protein DinB